MNITRQTVSGRNPTREQNDNMSYS